MKKSFLAAFGGAALVALAMFALPQGADAASCSYYRDLGPGMSGGDVACLQDFLRSSGHYSYVTTGYFGPVTQASVMRWQRAAGYPQTGFFAANTHNSWAPYGGFGYYDYRTSYDTSYGKDPYGYKGHTQESSNKVSAGKARDAIEDAKDAIDDAEDELDGEDNDDAEDLLDDAEDALDDAEDAYDDRDYDDAVDYARDARELAEDAIDEVRDHRDHDDGDEDDAWDALQDAEDALDDAWDEVDDAWEDYEDTDEAEDLLEEAEDALDDAYDAYDDGDYDDAIDLADEVEDLIDEALDEI